MRASGSGIRRSSRRVWRWRLCVASCVTAQLAAKHGIHPTMVGEWKRQAMEGMVEGFSGKSAVQESSKAAEVEKLHAKTGQLLVERDFLAKASGR